MTRVQTANNFSPVRPLHKKLVDHMNAKDAEGWELVNGSEHNATLNTLHYQWTTLFWRRPRAQEGPVTQDPTAEAASPHRASEPHA